jgi:hypothetical protein
VGAGFVTFGVRMPIQSKLNAIAMNRIGNLKLLSKRNTLR